MVSRWHLETRLLQQVQYAADAASEIDLDISVDSTIVRAHQHAAGARTDPPPVPAQKGGAKQQNTKPGSHGRACSMDKIRIPRIGAGRPRKKPNSLAADEAYSNGPCRQYLRRRGTRTKAARLAGQRLGAAKRSQIMFMDRDDILNQFVTNLPLPVSATLPGARPPRNGRESPF